MKVKKKPHLAKSETIKEIPLACANELAAVEFWEKKMWNGTPCCPHCKSTSVYKMMDAKNPAERNKRFLWRCHDCHKQFTVRVGTVMEESRIPLRHWVYATWRAATSKKGVAALEIQRDCQISYPSALFLMHRIRAAMTPEQPNGGVKLDGIVECDETYVGGKPRPGDGNTRTGRGTKKQPVFGMVERGGNIHRRVIADISGKTLKAAMEQCIAKSATIMTDEFPVYRMAAKGFEGGHSVIPHKAKVYSINGVSTNTAESSFAILNRGIMGIYHAVSREHLHRYISEFDFRWNTRRLNDGDRTVALIRGAQGKRLPYRTISL